MYINKFLKRRWGAGALILLIVAVVVVITGCTSGPSPSKSPGVTPNPTAASNPTVGVISGTVSGKVSNSLNGSPVAGVKIVTDPAIQGPDILSDNTGLYSATLPIGSYKLNITRNGFTAATDSVALVAGQW